MSEALDANIVITDLKNRIALLELKLAQITAHVAELEQRTKPVRVSVKKATVEPRTAHISATMSEHLKLAIQHEAARQQMTISQWIEDAALARLDWQDATQSG